MSHENFGHVAESDPTCTHRTIEAYAHSETGDPAALWGCAECKVRFYPAGKVAKAGRRVRNATLDEVVRAVEGLPPAWATDEHYRVVHGVTRDARPRCREGPAVVSDVRAAAQRFVDAQAILDAWDPAHGYIVNSERDGLADDVAEAWHRLRVALGAADQLQRYSLTYDRDNAYLELDPTGPWVLYQDLAIPCPHPDSWFDRTICPVDDWMHTWCSECGVALDGECG